MHMLSSLDNIQRFGASRVIASIAMRNYLYKKATRYTYDEFIQLAELLRAQIEATGFANQQGNRMSQPNLGDLLEQYRRNGMQIEYEFLGKQTAGNYYGLYALFAATE